ncbi:microcin C ABC transporter ATP-binding protein YejF [Serratia entomophila]|uniref:microcin C ABC transporter ATP-binding protein YejF n=1 Tax=Serratia entomophila TaxID=42906 RepID=UPI00217B9F44|nr:microcin C ABC transporter ATP-binding protein YejF [Serratia entomophila]CAI0785341.1 Glutathione import ATP-binding protein GsiA [Serratia entomophila]CAI1498983.1 Glutathione import ATP-binding protein GsiA [Serratia entomophila]CAI1505550.1 Glutathione import ATP-binding protein GsiA [Serratia entomophila]CAI1513903.1 Glutathione import ATP-binding protein GsiA [Serratia entomophila]CAI1601774.1 Glutathione import ATP-binding protein GsiA [Serratia entomophila]
MASTPLLSIQDLSIAFRQGEALNPVVNGLSLQIEQAETLALVGESGSGKSVTALSVLRLLPSPPVVYPSGDILFNGASLLHAPEPMLRSVRGNRIAMIFQEPMVSLNPLHTIEKQLAEVLILHRGMRRDAARSEIIQCLDRVGIRNAKGRLKDYPHQLSGGERQRVMIAMAVLTRPQLLIADEPTTALDVTIQAQILQLLQELKQELGMGLLFITHNLNIVRRLADNVAVMREGRCVEQNGRALLFSQPQHAYTRQLLAAEDVGEPLPLPQQPNGRPGDAWPLLKVENLQVRFPIRRGLLRRTVDYHYALKALSFELQPGESLGLVGESGSGKSTTGLALLRLLTSQGAIWFNGEPLHQLNMKQMLPYRSRMQIVFQDPYSALNPRLNVQQIIAEGLEVHQKLSAEQRDQRVIEVLREVGLDPQLRHRYPTEFSGGQRQRIAIARALILQPQLLILDEPTSSLDKSVQAQILTLLKSLQQRYRLAYLFISHDLQVVRSLCHQVIVLRQGEVVEQGDCRAIFASPAADYTRQLLQLAD